MKKSDCSASIMHRLKFVETQNHPKRASYFREQLNHPADKLACTLAEPTPE
ncbi:TPA: hypothetical protein ACWM1T_001838 [Legionella pneumophila]|nr:hypothetical protein [Legionella pneumophila]HBD7283592.1 hypothetical protein [Legionella pneumophila]HBD9439255.1 hypothetical protein [Legionella pneumophila]HEN8241110.1 hypothetical protein [Legionella pneumophila]|tara:strand:- start:227 stop:379 length:153 start_codon:yes stop_codon:yes gene_type:complete